MSFEKLPDFICRTLDAYRVLSREEETDVARKAVKGDLKARDTLIYSNMRFVIAKAAKYARKCNVSQDDIIMAGYTGMLRAVEKFNPSRNIRFITFASYYIDDEMRNECNYMGRDVKFTEDDIENLKRINDASREYEIDSSTAEGQKKISEKTGISEQKIRTTYQASVQAAYLENNIDSNGPSIMDTLYVNSDFDSFIFMEGLRNGIEKTIKNEDDKLIVKMKMGIDCEKISEREIAKILSKKNNKKICHTTISNRFKRCWYLLQHSRFMQGYEYILQAA